jgi:hypothetical protein
MSDICFAICCVYLPNLSPLSCLPGRLTFSYLIDILLGRSVLDPFSFLALLSLVHLLYLYIEITPVHATLPFTPPNETRMRIVFRTEEMGYEAIDGKSES